MEYRFAEVQSVKLSSYLMFFKFEFSKIEQSGLITIELKRAFLVQRQQEDLHADNGDISRAKLRKDLL